MMSNNVRYVTVTGLLQSKEGILLKRKGRFISSVVMATITAVSVGSFAFTESTYASSITQSPSGISSMNLQGMDLESALMAVQQQRSALIESQLQAQLGAVQSRNAAIAELNGKLTQAIESGDLELAQSLKNQIDALSSSQQMDMLRLQSLSNKRNEAFDVMTNFIKKMQDSRSSIIGNMR